tara:strand:- start:311 stop:523 length:213 start_codon:yes stop_codon:yes gene_type:complete
MQKYKFYLGDSGFEEELAEENFLTMEQLERLDGDEIEIIDEEAPGYSNIYFKGKLQGMMAISNYHIKKIN